jgi:hypothetical protein
MLIALVYGLKQHWVTPAGEYFYVREKHIMKFKHHLVRKFNQSKRVPLWKWVVIIFLVIAMPLFFALARMTKTAQVFENQEQGNQSR